MSSELKIYIDRLRENQTEKIDLVLHPSFMDVTEEDLSFDDQVIVKGEVTFGVRRNSPCSRWIVAICYGSCKQACV